MSAIKDLTAHEMIEALVEEALDSEEHISAHIVDLDDAVAQELLSRNLNNRKVSQTRVKRYRQDAENGKWVMNGQPIIISSDGILADGQHRAAAIAGTELSVPTLVIAGIDPEARDTLDQARPRNAGDYLQMRGEASGPIEAGMIRLVLAFMATEGRGLKGISASTSAEILQFFEENADAIRTSVDFAVAVKDSARSYIAASILAFCHYVFARINLADADTYIRQVAKGEDLTENDAAYTVRERLLVVGRVGSTRKAEIMFAGWNAFRENRPLKLIRSTGKLPGLK